MTVTTTNKEYHDCGDGVPVGSYLSDILLGMERKHELIERHNSKKRMTMKNIIF